MSDGKKSVRKWLNRAGLGAMLTLAGLAAAFLTLQAWKGGSADAYALSDLHWEFVDRPQPWDEPTKAAYTERCMAIAGRYPGTTGAAAALYMAIARGDPTPAVGPLTREIETAPLPRLLLVTDFGRGHRQADNFWPFAPIVLARAKASLDQPEVPELLARVCRMVAANPTAEFREAADLLVERFPTHPAAEAVPEVLGANVGGRVPAVAPQFERHLRTLLKTSPSARVRSRSAFALGCVLQSRGGESNPEAAELLEPLGHWDGTTDNHGEYLLTIEADHRLKKLRSGAVGMPAPATDGPDLDGNPLSLADYRGKVVLVVFWATWCGPCMAMVPHEDELAAKYRGRPFAILGVNADADPATARAGAAKRNMTWKSLRYDAPPEGTPSRLGEEWAVQGLPTVALVDAAGVVRGRWTGAPPATELDAAIERLVAAAEAGPAKPGAK